MQDGDDERVQRILAEKAASSAEEAELNELEQRQLFRMWLFDLALFLFLFVAYTAVTFSTRGLVGNLYYVNRATSKFALAQ